MRLKRPEGIAGASSGAERERACERAVASKAARVRARLTRGLLLITAPWALGLLMAGGLFARLPWGAGPGVRLLCLVAAAAVTSLGLRELLLRAVVRGLDEPWRMSERTRYRLADVAEASGDALIGLTVEGSIETWSSSAERLYGYGRSEALGRPFAFLTAASAREALERGLEAVRSSARLERFQSVLVTKEGRPFHAAITLSPILDGGGRVIGLASIARDVTQQKWTQELYENLLKAQSDIGDGVALLEGERLVYANEALTRLSGYANAELLGLESFFTLLPPAERPAFQQRLGPSGEAQVPFGLCETVLMRKDGVRIDLEYAVKPVSSQGPAQTVAIFRDVTERKLANRALLDRARELREANDQLDQANRQVVEEQLKVLQAERLASVGLLAAGVAHEINNPLTGITTCVKLLKDGHLSPERATYYFEVIENGLSRMATTVHALLGFARERPGTSPVDAAALIASCTPLMAAMLRKRDVEIDLQIRPGEVSVEGNSSQLAQATLNVLVNAVQASNAQSRVTVSASREGPRVGLHFQDAGIGIPRHNLRRVCDPFFTTKPEGEGTGLGLAITHDIIQRHGGELSITSEEGRGTKVSFWLPEAR